MKLYHVTDRCNKSSIIANGLFNHLKPSTSRDSREKCVYLTSLWDEVVNDPEFRFRELCLFEVDMHGLEHRLEPDEEWDSYDGVWAYKYEGSIIPGRITFLGDIDTSKQSGTSIIPELIK